MSSFLSRGEQPGGDAVDRDADRGDDHDGSSRDGGGVGEAKDRLPRDRPDGQEQEDRVEQGGEDRRAAQAVSEAGGRRAPDEDAREPGRREAEHVAEIVPGVGEQRDRAGREAIDRLDRDEGQVQRDADGEGGAEVGRPVRVGVGMVVAVVAGAMVVVVTVRMPVLVHDRPL